MCNLSTQTRGVAPHAPEKGEYDENGENGACHTFKGLVCRKPCLCAPEKMTETEKKSDLSPCASPLLQEGEVKIFARGSRLVA